MTAYSSVPPPLSTSASRPGADRAIAVRQPGAADRGIARHREALREADLRGVGIRVGQRRERHVLRGAIELRRQRLLRLANLALAVRIAPLHDVVVLRAHDREPVEVTLAHERDDVGHVRGRELAAPAR